MTFLSRALLGLSLLVLAAPCARAQPWPDPTDASSWTFAANRLSFPGNHGVVTGNNDRAALSHIYQVSPPYAVTNLRLLFANFAVLGDGSAAPEVCPGNGKNVDFATVFIGGTAHPVTFGGATSARIGDCEFIWSDPLRDAAGNAITIPAGTTYFIRSSQSVNAAGERFTRFTTLVSVNGRNGNPTLGEGVEYTSAPQTGKRLSGTVAAFSNGSALTGPAMAIAQGWNGSPVFLIVGDSNGAGQSDIDSAAATRGVYSFVGRALDDSTASTRYNFANLAVPGTRPGTQASIAAGQYRLRMRVLRSIPNRPFNRVLSQMGQNGLFTSLPQWQAEMRDFWAFWRDACPTCPVFQTTFPPRAQAASNTRWSDPALMTPTDPTVDAWPKGRRWAVNDWLAAGRGLPGYVTVIDTAPAFRDAAHPGSFKGLPGAWTIGAAITTLPAMGTIQLAGPSAPTPGDFYVIEPGTPNANTVQAITVTGTGPWQVYLTGNSARAHAAGAPVVRAPTGDGLHMGSTLHKDAAAILIRAKAEGTLR